MSQSLVVPDRLQGAWTSALILTYGTNLDFFETRLMSQLAQVPLRLILGDGQQLEKTFDEAANTGQRHRMANRAYLVGPIRHPRAAHAKLIMLLGPREGLIMAGSGNLSQDGYATPGELWHVYAYSDDRVGHLNEFASARALVDGLRHRGALDPPTAELLDTVWGAAPWLPIRPEAPTQIRHNLDSTLLDQLEAEVTWPVEELTTYAPFHDADCAALAEVAKRFHPRKLRVLVSRKTSVDLSKLKLALSRHNDSELVLIEVAGDEPTYVHAKWIHLVGRHAEALLSGSANLSRSALLNRAATGNIELGIISHGKRGEFSELYGPLTQTIVTDSTGLGLIYKSREEPEPSATPKVIWSRLEDGILTVAVDRMMDGDSPSITLRGPIGILGWVRMEVDGDRIAVELDPASAAALADGGCVSILFGNYEREAHTWPYHIGLIRSRLHRAGQRDLLPLAASLPEKDVELMAILHELEETLIFDSVSSWKVAKGGQGKVPLDDEAASIRWDELDWDRIRRDPRYSAYHYRGGGSSAAPTDIQVVLSAIAARLGELGAATTSPSPRESSDDDDLARESDTLAVPDEDVDEDARDDELTRRQLPISTRTRMAFTRFVTRYSAATRDEAFIAELGPVVAVHNAAIFNHLVIQLLDRNVVDIIKGVDAQTALLELLCGNVDRPGLVKTLHGEERDATDRVLADARVRQQALLALSRMTGFDLPSESRVKIRSLAQHLITDQTFGLDRELLDAAGPHPGQAKALLDNLYNLATSMSKDEVAEFVAQPLGVRTMETKWRVDKVRRGGRHKVSHLESVLVINRQVENLTSDLAREAVERLAVASYLGDLRLDYFRVRFEQNGRDVAFWDAECNEGNTWIGGDNEEIEGFDPQWPTWLLRLQELSSQRVHKSTA